MTRQRQARLFSSATSLALIFSLLFTSNVRADDPPNPPGDETVTQPSQQESVEPATVSELLEEIPENTDLVVVAEDQIVPLATNEAATAILQGDPIWCPEGAAPVPSANGCTDSYADLASLIDDFDSAVIAEPAANGVIWILAGTDASTFDIVIDGSVHTQWSNHALTLLGGWDGTSSGNINGTSSFSVPISIVNWNNTVTLSNINVFNTNTTGLEVETSGDILLENITSENNSDDGAVLISTAGSVTISGTNSFSNNGGSGVYLESNGDVQAENLTASGNAGNGAEIYSSGSVSVSGDNTFTDNDDSGLYVEADNTVEIGNVTATNNNGDGIELYSNSNIVLSGSLHLNENNGSGLYADALGSFQSNGLTAGGNGGSGAEIFAVGSITMNGASAFGGNNEAGLYVETDGDFHANNLAASSNIGYGAEIYAANAVSITGANFFSGNGESGLYVETDGNVSLENITATDNLGSGVEIQTSGIVTVGGMNVFTNNSLDGLFIDTEDDIFVYNINSQDNGLAGLYLETNGNATVTCGYLSNNAGYEIEADLGGWLILNGVDFGGDIDGEIGADEDHLILNSNSCFTYPDYSSDDTGNEAGIDADFDSDILPIQVILDNVGDAVNLECENHRGTLIYTQRGDGVYIPCPLEGTAVLLETAEDALPFRLPQDNTFLSGLDLTIMKDGESVIPAYISGSVWYTSPNGESGTQILYWDGDEWVEITEEFLPFMNIFFKIPEGMDRTNLAILYWDGKEWVELSERGHLGNGYIVKEAGHTSSDGLYFETMVNFTGTFILVQK